MSPSNLQRSESHNEPRRGLAPRESSEGLWPFGSAFGQLFSPFWPFDRRTAEGDMQLAPALDVSEDDHSYQVHVELAGLKKEDVKIQLENGLLCISGEKKLESEGRTPNVRERRYGSFCRTMSLPATANTAQATAEMKDGLLKIVIPKTEEAKPRLLPIK